MVDPSKLSQRHQLLLDQRRRRVTAKMDKASARRNVDDVCAISRNSGGRDHVVTVTADASAGGSSDNVEGTPLKASKTRRRPQQEPSFASNNVCHEFNNRSIAEFSRRGISGASNSHNIADRQTDESRTMKNDCNFSAPYLSANSHCEEKSEHKERLPQWGQQARRSAQVASAMRGMAMVIDNVTSNNDNPNDPIGNISGNRGKYHSGPQPQYLVALVTPEKNNETKSESRSMTSETVPRNNHNKGIDRNTVGNNADADEHADERDAPEMGNFRNRIEGERPDSFRSLEHWNPRPQEKQNTGNRKITTPPNYPSPSSQFPEKYSQTHRSHSRQLAQNATPSTPRSSQTSRPKPKSSPVASESSQSSPTRHHGNFTTQKNYPNKQPVTPSPSSRLHRRHRLELPSDPPDGTTDESSPTLFRNGRGASDIRDATPTQGNIPSYDHWECNESSGQKKQQLPTPGKLNQRLLRQFDRVAEMSQDKQEQQRQQPMLHRIGGIAQRRDHHQQQHPSHQRCQQIQRTQQQQQQSLHRQQCREQQKQQFQDNGIRTFHRQHEKNCHSYFEQHPQRIHNSQSQSYSKANNNPSNKDYQFDFDTDDGTDDVENKDHEYRSGHVVDDIGVGDFDDELAIRRELHAGINGNTTATNAERDRVITVKKDDNQVQGQRQRNADDPLTPPAQSGGEPYSPSGVSAEWNEAVEIYDEESSCVDDCSNGGNSGEDDSGWGAIPMNGIRDEDLHDVYDDFRKRRQTLKGDVDDDEDEGEDIWGDWEDPFELHDAKSSNARNDNVEMDAMNSSHDFRADPVTSPDRTTVVTSNIYTSSSVKSALSLLNGKVPTTTIAEAATAQIVADGNEIARRIAIDPPPSSGLDTHERKAHLSKSASKAAPDSPAAATPQTLSSQYSATQSPPRTPRASNATTRASPSAAKCPSIVTTNPGFMSREQRRKERKECAPSFDEAHSWTTATSSAVSSQSLYTAQEDDTHLRMQKQEHCPSRPPLSTLSSKVSVKPSIISIHGDSSVISDDDSIFSNFSHLRQMRVRTNANKNKGDGNSRHLNPLNNSANTSVSSIANTASVHDISVGSLDDILDCGEGKNGICAIAGMEETSLDFSHTQSDKSVLTFNAPSFDEAKNSETSTIAIEMLSRPLEGMTSTSPPHFRAQTTPMNAKTGEITQTQSRSQLRGPSLQTNNHALVGRDGYVVGDDKSELNDSGDTEVITNQAENCVRETTWTNTSNADSSMPSSQTLIGMISSRSNPHLPPTHPSPPSASYNAVVSHQHVSSVNFGSPSGCHPCRSPTGSDHSADAAAGAEHAMHLRQPIFGDLSEGRSPDLACNDEIGTNDGRLVHPNLATITDDGIEPKLDNLGTKLDKLHHSLDNVSTEDSSPYADWKLVSSKISGGISVQPSFESECLRQNAAIAMQMDHITAIFHDHRYGGLDFHQHHNVAIDTADPMLHELLAVSRAESSKDSAEDMKDDHMNSMSSPTCVPSAVIQHDAATNVQSTNEPSVLSLEAKQRVNHNVFNSRAGFRSHRYFSRSNRLSSRLFGDQGHFASLLSVDEESAFEEPSWVPATDPNNAYLPDKKSLDPKLSEKNDLTQLMDTIMRGCYPNDVDNSYVFSYRDENNEVNLTPVEVDEDKNKIKETHRPDQEPNHSSKQNSLININRSQIAKERERIRKQDTTPLRTNTSKGKENMQNYHGNGAATAGPLLSKDAATLTQVPRLDPIKEVAGPECTNFKVKLPPTRNQLSMQGKSGASPIPHEESARKVDSVLDGDVVQSYRVTQNSDVLQSYRMQDRKMPSISKLLFQESSTGIDDRSKNKLPRNDGNANAYREERSPKEQAAETAISWSGRDLERSDDEMIHFDGKINKYRGSTPPEEPPKRDTTLTAVSDQSKVDFHRHCHSNKGCMEEALPWKPDAKNDKILRMSEREKNKGRSLAWQSSNGVNGDEEFSRKERLPRAQVMVSGRPSLQAMVKQSASFREHFRDNRSNAFHLQNPLYNPSANFDHIIQEGSHEDSDHESGNQNFDEEELIPEYHYDTFVSDFKDILQNEHKSKKGDAPQTTIAHVERSQEGVKSDKKSSINEKPNFTRESNAASILAEKPSNVAITRAVFETSLKHNQLRHTSQLPVPVRIHSSLPVEKKKAPVKENFNSSKKKMSIGNAAPNITNPSGSARGMMQSHNFPFPEVSKSLLEEKLKGLKGGGKKECGTSVATSELGSLLTRESEASHKFVPRYIFHRTRPSSDIDTLQSSPLSMQNTFDDTGHLLVQTETNNSKDLLESLPRTGKRVRIVLPDPSAPMVAFEDQGKSTNAETSVASRIRLLETHRSLGLDKDSGGSLRKRAEVNDIKLGSSKADAAAAISRTDMELGKVRSQYGGSTIATTSASYIPNSLCTKRIQIQNSTKKTQNGLDEKTISVLDSSVLDSSGHVKKAASTFETMKVADFWKHFDQSSVIHTQFGHKPSISSPGNIHVNHPTASIISNKSGADDGSQVSFSEAFEIAPRVQLDGKDGHIKNFGVYNVVNGAVPRECKTFEALTDSTRDEASFGPIHDVYESSSHHAFEIVPVQKAYPISLPPTERSHSSRIIPPTRTDELPKTMNTNTNPSGGRVKSSPFMKNSWAQRIMKSNNSLSETTKKTSIKPISLSEKGGKGSATKRTAV